MNLMQLPDEYQNDPQGREKSHKEEEAKQLIEKIFSVNSYFYHSFSKFHIVGDYKSIGNWFLSSGGTGKRR